MRPALWEVDAQADFMLPGGKLYVPGAEKIAGNLNRLVESARQDRAFLVSSADAHSLSDPEFREWPPHCLKGTPGAELIPEARAARCKVIPNQKGFALPRDLAAFQQVLLEKNTLDVFDNPNTEALLAQMSTAAGTGSGSPLEFLLFGVVTEHCVRYATEGLLRRGHRVSIVTDAIQSLDEKKGKAVLDELQVRGARLITTKEALVMLGADSRASSR
jgi:nicotinamidase/pyrazinamidase